MLKNEKLGLEIKKRRKSRNFTQMQLAQGICDQSEISRIEKGIFSPSIDTLYQLSSRLQTPISYFFEILIHDEVDQTKTIKKNVRELSLNKDYTHLNIYIDSLLVSKSIFHPELKKFLHWQKQICLYYLKKIDFQYCLTELRTLLREKTSGLDILLDNNIKNSIANLLAENQKYKESTTLFEEVLKDCEDTIEFAELKIKANYNYGKLLYMMKDYNNALKYTEVGIEISKSVADMSLLGQLYYQKGSILEELQSPNSVITDVYKKASFLFDILELHAHKKILLSYKMKYLSNDIMF